MPIYPRRNCPTCGVRFTPETENQTHCLSPCRSKSKARPAAERTARREKPLRGERSTASYRW